MKNLLLSVAVSTLSILAAACAAVPANTANLGTSFAQITLEFDS